MIDDRHFEYDKLSNREIKQRRMQEKGYDYLCNLCGTRDLYYLKYRLFGEVLTFNYNTLDDTGKLITIKRTVQLEENLVKDKRLLRNLKTDIFFDRRSNQFIYKRG